MGRIKDMTKKLGLALILVGLPSAWLLRALLPGNEKLFSQGIILAAMILLLPGLRRRYRVHQNFALIFCSLMLSIFCLLLYNTEYNIKYELFLAILALFLLLQRPDGFENVVTYIFVISYITTLGILIYNFNNIIHPASGSRLQIGSMNSPNQIAFMAGTGLVSIFFTSLTLKMVKSALMRVTLRMLIFYSAICIYSLTLILANTRSVFLGIALVLLYLARRIKIKTRIPVKKLLPLAVVLLLVFVCTNYLFGDVLFHYVGNVVNYFTKGYKSYTQGLPTEQSAFTRRNLINYGLHHITLMGRGVLHKYLDFPILQGFVDLGIFGGLAFVFITLLLPAYFILFRWKYELLSNERKFFILNYILFIPNLFFHGQPYDYPLWIPIILLFFFNNPISVSRKHHTAQDKTS